MSSLTINNNRIVSCDGNEQSILIPAGITRIGTGAFKGKNVEEIVFEDGSSLKSIDEEAFADCQSLKSILIPNSVVQIGDRAFSGCKALLYIRIPSSVILVGEDVLFGHNSDLVIIGEKGTEAENIANKYGITLQGNEQRTIEAVLEAKKGKSSAETRSFEILGETVTCSNTLAKYQEAIEYYASRKEPFFTSYIKQFTNVLSARTVNMLEVFEAETDCTVDRLAKKGVLTTSDAVREKYLLELYQMTLDGLEAVIKLRDSVDENVNSDISSMKEQLAREAESKVTGLSYGIIGDGFDLLAYSIDDFSEKQRQRKFAYAEAEMKYDQYRRDQINQRAQLFADAMKEIMPTLIKLSDLFIEKLFEAEIDFLKDAGIIEENVKKGLDIQKSAQLIQSVINKRDDNTFTAVLAIKKYPCNVAALTYVYEHNPSCAELKELIQFVGLSSQVDKGLSESKQSRLNSYIRDVENVSTASQGIDLIQKEIALFSDDEIKEMLLCVARAITPKIEEIALGEKKNAIADTKEYCAMKLNGILSQNDWDFFEKYNVSPIVSNRIPRDSRDNHSLLLDWLSSKLSEMLVHGQKYDKYLEKYPLKREEERTRSELKAVQEKINIIQTKTWEEDIVSVLKRVFGAILIVGGIAVGAVAESLVMAFVIAIPGLLVFLSVFIPSKRLRTLRKEEKVLLDKIAEIEKLPPFIEDDKLAKDAYAKVEAERLEREQLAEKAAKKLKGTITTGTIILVTCIVLVIVLIAVIVPKQKHNAYIAAVAKYGKAFESASVGDVVLFGGYEQDNNTSNGKEDIEWIVLARDGNRLLLISRYVLDSQQYNTYSSDVAWETCSLRDWLNSTFLGKAFNAGEKAMISSSNIGNNTTDQVFLLNNAEIHRYFASENACQCVGTTYSNAQGLYTKDDGNCIWWVRSSPSDDKYADFVYVTGEVFTNGNSYITNQGCGVRPAVWIEL